MAAPGKAVVKEILAQQAEQLAAQIGHLSENNAKREEMETASKAQQELERIERQISQLAAVATGNEEASRRLGQLHEQVKVLREQLKTQRVAWQKTELARHPQRPYFLDYVENMLSDFSEVHGDRGFADDPALICGMARFRGEEVMVMGQQKGRDVKQRVYRNFGQASPEGYRKALRCMKLAEKFSRPILTFIDTPGAFPGLGAEERGQAEAIARNLREMARLQVPIIVTVTGEGGSGGALAIAIGDRILMLENSIYSVISPEGCASIMWRDAKKRELAAEALRVTAQDQLQLGVIDQIVKEPEGGAHSDAKAAADLLADAISRNLDQIRSLPPRQLVASRYDKFRKMAQFFTSS
jgi:acetyl-CoA carboxylase carboxyl transferase subunit alpha